MPVDEKEKLEIKDMIYTIRGQQVMLGNDLANVFGYETKPFNKQVKRHCDEFADGKIIQLTKEEVSDLRSQFDSANININSKSRTLPNAFTLQGIEVLSTILRAENLHQIMNNIRSEFTKQQQNSMVVMSKNTDDIKSLIYTVRGEQVMLNLNLADIYGYDIKSFNRQVVNNIEKFDSDFMFELSKDEWDELWRKFYATTLQKKSRTRPYAFTEAGIYMLMTVLKGELATEQSKMLIRTFKQMRHYFA